MNENETLTRAAGVISFFTFFSRILGLARDILIAGFFGSGMFADAFFVAFKIPNLLRRLFAEGSFSVSFIPVFSEYLRKKSREDACEMARVVLTFLVLILAIVTITGIIFSPYIVRIIAPGFATAGEKFSLTVLLTRIMFPYVLLISVFALFMSILNSLKHFAAPAMGPIFLNVFMIIALLFLAPHMKNPTVGLSIGVLAGGVVQLFLQVPFLISRGISLAPKWDLKHPALKKIGLLMVPAMFGSAVYQINQLIGTLLASLLEEGSVSYLYYADRLVQFPLGVFAIAISTAALPAFSRVAADGEIEKLKKTLSHALRVTMFITIPSMIGLIVLREPVIKLLFQRGAFDSNTTIMTARALLCYSLGLWAFSALRIIVSAFYSLQDTKTPVKVAIMAMLLNVSFSVILMRTPLKHAGLAMALSLASIFQLGILIYLLKKKLGEIYDRETMISIAKTLISSFLMGICIYFPTKVILADIYSQSFPRLAAGVFTIIGIGVFIYFLSSKALGSRELISFCGAFKLSRK